MWITISHLTNSIFRRTHTWLPDAAKAGARFIQSYYVDKVLFSSDAKTKAIGVTGTWGPQKVPLKIMAKKVIVSAGSLHSPCLLLRSGLSVLPPFPIPLHTCNH